MDRLVHKKKKKKTFHPFRALSFLVIFILIILVYYYRFMLLDSITTVIAGMIINKGCTENVFSTENPIVGQTKVINMDGYTTIYTTLKDSNKKSYIEYKQNLENSSWSENSYWGGTMAENGCGITSMAIIASGYGHDLTPDDFRTKYYPHLDSDEIPSELKKLGIKCSDFYYYKTYLSKKYISEWLYSNRPVLICVDNSKKENKWTTLSHYMVLLDVNENGLYYLSNPNGEDGAENASGWYSPEEILPYVVKALFIESH